VSRQMFQEILSLIARLGRRPRWRGPKMGLDETDDDRRGAPC
jgi:hypothetical protein